MKKISYLIVTILFLTNSALFAQTPGQHDISFNSTDLGFSFGDGANFAVKVAAVQADGKIVIGGNFTNYNGVPRTFIARINADGSIDQGFSPGFNPSAGANNYVNTIAIQPDGKIVIGGDFTSYLGTSRNRIARLNANGSIDASFNPGTGADNSIGTAVLQPNGKIIIGGDFTSYNGTSRNRIARLNADGSLDPSFNPGSGAGNWVRAVAIQQDGKIILGGEFTSYNGTSQNRIIRLNADGSLDPNFNTGTGANNKVSTIKIQSNGKIIIGGGFTNYKNLGPNYLARLNADGSLDNTFNPGTGAGSFVNTVELQPDGKIILGGYFTSYNNTDQNRITRLNADGSLDTNFNVGTGANDIVWTVPVQTDGKIIIGGNFTSYNNSGRNYIARINANGSADLSFNPGTGANNAVRSVTVQTDGKIIVSGEFTSYNNIGQNYLARLNADGSLDASFNPGLGANNWVWATAVQANGKIIIAGWFTTFNGVFRSRIARLNTDGSLDSSFDPGFGADGIVTTVAVQTDGKIIIGGYFNNFNSISRNYIARLNSDGSLDTSFNPGTGPDYDVWSALVQPNGKIIIGGNFTSYNGTGRKGIARLNADGSLDTSFNPGSGADGNVLTVALQATGKIIIGGEFIHYNGSIKNYLARLNTNGSIDPSFNPAGTGPNSGIYTIAIQGDDKINIGGNFDNYNGTVKNRITRLLADGSLDMNFNPGNGGSLGTVLASALQNDGKIIIGGTFNSYNGIGRNRLARIHGSVSLGTSVSLGVDAENRLFVYPNPAKSGQEVIVKLENALTSAGIVYLYDALGRQVMQQKIAQGQQESILSVKGLPTGLYQLKVITKKFSDLTKIVIQ
jgi:uncharacterized delta-60 repeat protein